MRPLVRVVVVNHNGGQLLDRCLASLAAVEWPEDRLDVVLIDNASTDGSAARARDRHPRVRLIQADRNLGFGAANNLALADLAGVDYVALLNNDAFVEPSWLSPLVQALEEDPALGAACPKILFADGYVEVMLEAPAFRPRRGDYRRLGVQVSGARVAGEDRWTDIQFVRGWHGWDLGRDGELFQWTGAAALLRLPSGGQAELRVAGEHVKRLTARSGAAERSFDVGPEPSWIDVPFDGAPLDVIHNVGSVAVRGGHGGDRGYLEVDSGQYDRPAEVFAWCGCSVLLRRRYLEDVGLFDPDLFLYYEDFDLSWRGRARGWRYRYVPESVVRHRRTASSVEGSPPFQHYVERNRLLVHMKNAPARYAAYAALRHLGGTGRYLLRDVASPLLRGKAPRPGRVGRRLGTFAAAAGNLPAALRARRALRRRQTVPDRELLRWREPRPR